MYKNRFTRANPGLLVFMVDQSGSMGDPWADGKSKAEMTSLVINRCIQETIQKTTDIKEGVKDEVKIVVIGYGGIEKSDNAYVIVKGSNAELADSPLRTEMVTKKQPDGAGGLVETKYNMAIWVEPKAVWGTPMASAFEMAYQLIDGWVKKTQNRQVNPEAGNGLPQDDPVPIIINITDGMPTDSKEDVVANANKIKSITCPDGNPLIFNVHLDPKAGGEIMFTTQKPSDEYAELMFNISSELPEAFVADAKSLGFEVSGGEKTFISNCSKVETFISFLNFGTQRVDQNPG